MSAAPEPTGRPASRRWLTRGVVSIGIASLFSDIGHEMATALLPALLVTLGGSAATLGLIEGLADLGASGAKLGAGWLGARIRHRKAAATAGYLVTAFSKASFALAHGWPAIFVARLAGWLGRGFRSPLRDTLLAEQTVPESFGKAYGLERAMDSIGAVLGPLGALGLTLLAVELRTIFLCTLIPGLLAAALFYVGVRETPSSHATNTPASVPLPPAFRRLLVAVGVFGLGDFSRTLLLLWATGHATAGSASLTLPLGLYVLFNAVAAASSFLAGQASDRLGRKPLLLLGYAVATATSGLLVADQHALAWMLPAFVGSGVYFGILEAVEKATAADLLAPSQRSWGFGLLATVTGVGDFVSSLTVGLLWQWAGPRVAFGFSAGAMLLGLVALVVLVPSARRPAV